MDTLWFYLWPIIGPTAVVSIVALATKTWVTTRIQKGVEHQYTQKIEAMKAEIAAQAAEISMAHKSLHDLSLAFHGRRLDALDRMWRSFIAMDNALPAFLVLEIDCLFPAEWAQDIGKLKLRAQDLEVNEAMFGTACDQERPFVGELVWNYFFAYRVVILRTNYLVREGIKTGKIDAWWEDQAIKLNLEIIFTKSEFDEFNRRGIGKLAWTRDVGRRSFSRLIEDAASGAKLTETVIKEKARIAKLRELADAAELGA
jgi:hypothetical protein